MKPNFQSNIILNNEIKKKIKKEKSWVSWIILLNSQLESWDMDNPIKNKFNVERYEIEITS